MEEEKILTDLIKELSTDKSAEVQKLLIPILSTALQEIMKKKASQSNEDDKVRNTGFEQPGPTVTTGQ
jgi:hypothetical protein